MFTSSRERNLWIGSALVVVTIIVSLRFAGILVLYLRAFGVVESAYAVAAAAVVGLVIVLGASAGLRRRNIAIVVGALVILLLLAVRLLSPEERTHLIEYGVLALLIREALRERRLQGRPIARSSLIAVLIAGTIGLLDEGAQLMMPYRESDWRDASFNVIAAVAAVLVSDFLARTQESRTASPPPSA